MILIAQFENQFLEYIQAEMAQDLAHDINHVLRVVKTAKLLCRKESAIEEIIVPAAYLHDCFSFGKNHPRRSQSSKIAADKAISFLGSIAYPQEYLDAIHHAIVAHSYSAGVEPETLEAKIVQDADRLDALGATGIARCMQVGSKLGRPLYSNDDPFCSNRLPDDSQYTIDHFYTKLFSLAGTMNTTSAKNEAELRSAFMREYLRQMQAEVNAC